MQPPRPITEIDPFDLPEWLGVAEVTWQPETGLRDGHHVTGHLTGGDEPLACDLLAVDEAYPRAVVDDRSRSRAHQAWQHGQVLVGEYDGRLTVAAPGTRFDAELVLDALARLARAVGASADRWAARLRIGTEGPRRPGR